MVEVSGGEIKAVGGGAAADGCARVRAERQRERENE